MSRLLLGEFRELNLKLKFRKRRVTEQAGLQDSYTLEEAKIQARKVKDVEEAIETLGKIIKKVEGR